MLQQQTKNIKKTVLKGTFSIIPIGNVKSISINITINKGTYITRFLVKSL